MPEVLSVSVPIRIKRGIVHSCMCRLLKIPRSNKNVKLIKAVLIGMGFRDVTIRGRLFYTNIPPREMIPPAGQ